MPKKTLWTRCGEKALRTRWVALIIALMMGPAACNAAPATVEAYMGQPQVKADARIAYGPAPYLFDAVLLPKSNCRLT